MFNYSKDGVVVSTVLGARTINKEGKYPVKIKGYYQKRPKYDSIGICMTKEEWNKLPGSKSFEYRKIKQAIESCFSLVRMNVEALAEKGIFSFNTLNLPFGKGISWPSSKIDGHINRIYFPSLLIVRAPSTVETTTPSLE